MKSRGVLLFAFNNEQMDYVRIARYCAYRIKREWKLPVCLVTDADLKGDESLMFDQVLTVPKVSVPNMRTYKDYGASLTFNNTNRVMALRLTPFDQTLVIDTDMVVTGDTIPRLWSDQPLLLTKSAYNLNGQPMPQDLVRLGRTDLPMYWATIVCFDKHAPEAQHFFAAWENARLFYAYYAKLFGFDWGLFRNDFAVSVAMHQVYQGVTASHFDLPYSIPTAFTDIQVEDLEPLSLTNMGKQPFDVHIMHKKSLLEAVCRLEGF